jgi:hypothetical protein
VVADVPDGKGASKRYIIVYTGLGGESPRKGGVAPPSPPPLSRASKASCGLPVGIR